MPSLKSTMTAMGDNFHQFLIMMYKGLLLRKRHYFVTLIEIIIPLLISSIAVIVTSTMSSSPNNRPTGGGSNPDKKPTFYPPFNPFDGYGLYDLSVLYTPNTTQSRNLLEKALDIYSEHSPSSKLTLMGYDTEEELEKNALIIKAKYKNVLGTVLLNFWKDDDGNLTFPSSLDYKIRFGDASTYYLDEKYFPAYVPNFYEVYKSSGFLLWQASVEQAFISLKSNKSEKGEDFKVMMQRYPYPPYQSTISIPVRFISMFISYGYVIFFAIMVKRIVQEKANHSKELLKMMGMADSVYWSSTFLNSFLFGGAIAVVIVILYKIPVNEYYNCVLNRTGFFAMLLIILLYLTASILFCLMMTTLFNKPNFAVSATLLLHVLSHDLLMGLVFTFDYVSPYLALTPLQKYAICLLPNGAIQAATMLVAAYETLGPEDVQTGIMDFNMHSDFTLTGIVLTMLLSCFIFSVIIWYLDAAWPWQFGVPKPFYFPFTKSYWCNTVDETVVEEDWRTNDEFFEKDPEGIRQGIAIRHLTKAFNTGSGSKNAVDNVSMNIYCGQITALLGRNGAGKTTTINMLTGLFLPNSGTASINGWDIRTHTKKARASLGICPQHDVLYETLTVEEHLKIYAALKGVKWAELSEEVTNTLRVLKLEDKRDELSKNLSGGMKRKLSLGIAIIGGSKVLFLDEPTSGMDPEARRGLWDILLSIRLDRTIVLTTHYMEEADILGDRIAIMADGRIQCSGTPMFLKKKFGTGYRLHIVKGSYCDIDSISRLIREHIPQMTLENSAESSTLVYSFGDNTAGSAFGTVFQNLEAMKEKLGISSFGITVTTMDDVFLRVSLLADEIPNEGSDTESVSYLVQANNEEGMFPQYEILYDGFELWLHKFKGLFFKRLTYAQRYWNILLCQVVIPFAIMCALLALLRVPDSTVDKSEKSLKLDLRSIYGKTKGAYNFPLGTSEIGSVYQSLLESSGVDATQTDDPGAYALTIGRKNPNEYKKKLSVGGVGNSSQDHLEVTAWYNGDPYHMLPISLNMMHVTLLRYFTNNMTASMTLINSPFPSKPKIYSGVDPTFIRSMSCVLIPLALAYLSATYVLVPIKECNSRAKLLQLMTGASPFTYWLAMAAWDMITHIFTSLLLIIPFAIFAGYVFFPHPEAIGGVIIMLLLFGWSIMPICYILSRIISKPATGFTLIICFITITGLVVPVILTSLNNLLDQDKLNIALYFLRFLPTFAVTWGFSHLMVISYDNAFCDRFSDDILNATCNSLSPYDDIKKCCKDEYGNNNFNKTYPFTWDPQGCGRDIVYLYVDGFLFYALLLLLETGILQRILSRLIDELPKRNTRKGSIVLQQMVSNITSDDSDVLDEAARIFTIGVYASQEEALIVKALTKYYRGFCAVNGLSFGVHKEECFGLLGINGAGKTSTFKMLTGDIYPTSGDAIIFQTSVVSNLKQFQSYIGYCPQFDALIDRLTGREMLNLFASLRGITNIEICVSKIIASVDLQEHADKQTRLYSGGNKRKLSIALALLASPPVILLDEPTAGIDPVSRRKIWNVLSQTRKTGKSAIILCTHSMEECEALCLRLAIMVNGKFCCLGSIQHLKSKFGLGFTVTIKLERGQSADNSFLTEFRKHFENTFIGSTLKDYHQGMFQFYISDASIPWSYLFISMEEMKQSFQFEDYLISGTTLEQIFLGFARNQRNTEAV